MKSAVLAAALALQASRPALGDVQVQCQIETATLCGVEGCRNVAPTLTLYLGDYVDANGARNGYYYRCRRGGGCDIIDNPWIGDSGSYRAFVAREQGVISKLGSNAKVTDVATLEDKVLISRGSCWNFPRPAVRIG